jgi:hypothetical protein
VLGDLSECFQCGRPETTLGSGAAEPEEAFLSCRGGPDRHGVQAPQVTHGLLTDPTNQLSELVGRDFERRG